MDEPTAAGEATRRCEWCSATAASDAATCPGCGAALPAAAASAGTEEPYYPGITDIAPHLKAAAARPLQVPGRAPTALMGASAMRIASQAGPGGLLIGMGAMAAFAAVDRMGASRRHQEAPALIDQMVGTSRPADRDIQAVLAKLDGKWQPEEVGEPGSTSKSDLEADIPDPPAPPSTR